MFGFVKLKFLQRKYRKLNSHNCTCIMNLCDISKIVVGKKSYGNIILSEGSLDDYKLIIGNYCSIAPNVVFLLANEHNLSSISTYPFKALIFGMGREAKGKGNIIIEDDVWIGYGAIICSGVSIGRGAVIGAGAVVTKDVEPYSVVAGNPAHFIKYRFEKNIIQQLLELNICQLFDSFSKEDVPLIYNDLDEKIIEQLQNRTNNSK